MSDKTFTEEELKELFNELDEFLIECGKIAANNNLNEDEVQDGR